MALSNKLVNLARSIFAGVAMLAATDSNASFYIDPNKKIEIPKNKYRYAGEDIVEGSTVLHYFSDYSEMLVWRVNGLVQRAEVKNSASNGDKFLVGLIVRYSIQSGMTFEEALCTWKKYANEKGIRLPPQLKIRSPGQSYPDGVVK